MSVKVTDKRGTGTRKASTQPETIQVENQEQPVPGWWPELVAVDQELTSVVAKHGEPTQQGNNFDTFGNDAFAYSADEYKRRNDARKEAGKSGRWADIILEELFEALEIEATAETAGELYAELIQTAAMALAAAESLRVEYA